MRNLRLNLADFCNSAVYTIEFLVWFSAMSALWFSQCDLSWELMDLRFSFSKCSVVIFTTIMGGILCCTKSFIHVRLSVTLWTVSCQALVYGILQVRILEWAAMPSSRRSSRSRYWTQVSYVSCIGMWILYHYYHLGNPVANIIATKVPKACAWVDTSSRWNRAERFTGFLKLLYAIYYLHPICLARISALCLIPRTWPNQSPNLIFTGLSFGTIPRTISVLIWNHVGVGNHRVIWIGKMYYT